MPLSPQKQVAGDRDGITAFQMDIKCEGLSISTLERAIEQAREGRLQILDKMLEACPSPRSELPASVPKVERMSVNPSEIGKIIGPGGKMIRSMIEEFELANIDIQDDGRAAFIHINDGALEAVVPVQCPVALPRGFVGQRPRGQQS